MRLELRFQLRAQRAGLDAGGAAGGVHLQYAVKALHVQRHGRCITAAHSGFHAAAHAGATAIRDHGHVVARGPIQDVDHGLLVIGVGHPVWYMGHLAQPHAGQIGVALAQGVIEPVQRGIREHGRQGCRRGDAWRRQREVTDLGLSAIRDLPTQHLHHHPDAGRFFLREVFAGDTPTPEAAKRAARERGVHREGPFLVRPDLVLSAR